MLPSACIGRTVAGMRPSRSSAIALSAVRGAPSVILFYPTLDRPRPAGRGRACDDSNRTRGAWMAGLEMFSLKDRVALVPGGGGGIGAPMAEALAEAGAKVAVAGRTAETLQAAIDRVTAAGSEGLAVTGDATSEDDAQRIVRETIDRFG